MSDEYAELRLFPLQTVLFPRGRLGLRIFERRYTDLVTHCLRADQPFGICLIAAGNEVGEHATPETVGTAVRIIDWNQRHDGLLGITVEGERRFEIVQRRTPAGQAQEATVRWLPQPPTTRLPSALTPLADLLERILNQLDGVYSELPRDLADADWVSARLAELLPLPNEARQQLLEIDSAEERLALIREALDSEPSPRR